MVLCTHISFSQYCTNIIWWKSHHKVYARLVVFHSGISEGSKGAKYPRHQSQGLLCHHSHPYSAVSQLPEGLLEAENNDFRILVKNILTITASIRPYKAFWGLERPHASSLALRTPGRKAVDAGGKAPLQVYLWVAQWPEMPLVFNNLIENYLLLLLRHPKITSSCQSITFYILF